MVAAMFAVQTVSSGLGFYNMSVYINEFSKVLDLPIADVSFAVTLFFLCGGATGMYVARLLDQIDVRLIMTVSALLCGVALYLVGSVRRASKILRSSHRVDTPVARLCHSPLSVESGASSRKPFKRNASSNPVRIRSGTT